MRKTIAGSIGLILALYLLNSCGRSGNHALRVINSGCELTAGFVICDDGSQYPIDELDDTIGDVDEPIDEPLDDVDEPCTVYANKYYRMFQCGKFKRYKFKKHNHKRGKHE